MQRRSSSLNGSTLSDAAWAVAADAAKGAPTHDCWERRLALSIGALPAPNDIVVQRITRRLVDREGT
jgi:hypothetical protein